MFDKASAAEWVKNNSYLFEENADDYRFSNIYVTMVEWHMRGMFPGFYFSQGTGPYTFRYEKDLPRESPAKLEYRFQRYMEDMGGEENLHLLSEFGHLKHVAWNPEVKHEGIVISRAGRITNRELAYLFFRVLSNRRFDDTRLENDFEKFVKVSHQWHTVRLTDLKDSRKYLERIPTGGLHERWITYKRIASKSELTIRSSRPVLQRLQILLNLITGPRVSEYALSEFQKQYSH